MTLRVSSNGTTRDIDIDLDYTMAYEEEHPGWSLYKLLEAQDECLRYTDLDIVARCLGFDGLKDMASQGYTVPDMIAAIRGSKFAGFSDGTAED